LPQRVALKENLVNWEVGTPFDVEQLQFRMWQMQFATRIVIDQVENEIQSLIHERALGIAVRSAWLQLPGHVTSNPSGSGLMGN